MFAVSSACWGRSDIFWQDCFVVRFVLLSMVWSINAGSGRFHKGKTVLGSESIIAISKIKLSKRKGACSVHDAVWIQECSHLTGVYNCSRNLRTWTRMKFSQ